MLCNSGQPILLSFLLLDLGKEGLLNGVASATLAYLLADEVLLGRL